MKPCSNCLHEGLAHCKTSTYTGQHDRNAGFEHMMPVFERSKAI